MKSTACRNVAEHPDFVLLENREERPLCCLVMQNLPDTAMEALEPLHAFHIYHQGEMTALLLDVQEEADFLGRLEEHLAGHGLCAGLSGPFALAASAHGCMRKALIALETGLRLAPGRALYPMDEFGEAALLLAAQDVLAREGYAAEDFCDGAIARMRRVDEETGTQYAPSLQAYLSCGLDLRLAAQALGVHRNTLAYRMKRVQEIFSVDLENVNTCFELLFSFWLADNLPQAERGAEMEGPFDARTAEAALFAHVQRIGEDGCAPASGFACRMFCAGVAGIMDEDRIKLLRLLRALAPENSACAFDDDVILMVTEPDAFDMFEAAAAPQCRQKGCPVVTTQAFDAPRIGHRARLCRMALCAADQMCMRAQDMASTLFFMALEGSVSLAPYLCEDVIRVMDEDAQKRSALSRSLYAYLLNFRDMKRAAQQLGLHRNTMEYHMRKIDALIGKPSGEKRRFLMMCTYKMLALPDMRRYGL
ncbi:MAG: helix-turn-helix domain-containing protein [Clostridia bacterium]|nr:helix-turn-helix domain-containing protein [Clostridia bacterium]